MWKERKKKVACSGDSVQGEKNARLRRWMVGLGVGAGGILLWFLVMMVAVRVSHVGGWARKEAQGDKPGN